MFAQWCLTAWKVAIGRPNCSRTLAYSAAWSVVSRATPAASAASTARATPVSSRRAPGSTVAGAASSRTLAARRLWSRLAGTSARTPPADFSITSTSSPAGTSSTSARWPLITTPTVPVAAPSACLTSPPSATAPITLPSASAGSSRFCRSSGPAHLLGHDQRFGQPEARAAMFFRNVQPEQAEAAQLGPEGRPRDRLGPEQAAGLSAGLMLGQKAGDGLREGPVLFGDGDRHS